MKNKIKILILSTIFCQNIIAQPNISNVQSPTTIGQFNKFELTFDLNQYSNPFDPEIINVYCEFWDPNGKYYKQNAFYFEGYNKVDSGNPNDCEVLSVNNSLKKWKVRFTPNIAGTWQYKITAIDNIGNASYPSSNTNSFVCSISQNKGFIQKSNKRYLSFNNGDNFFPIGNSLPWFENIGWRESTTCEYGSNQIKGFMDTMYTNKMNFFRLEVNFLEGINLIGYDFINDKNYCKFYNQKDAWQLDQIIEYAEIKKIHILLALFAHAYLGDNGTFDLYHSPDGNIYSYGYYNSNNDYIGGYSNGAWSKFHPYNQNISTINRPVSPDSQLSLNNPYEWYSSVAAKSEQKKLIRYILARWGYSTSVMGYELMDEADRIDHMNNNDTHPSYVQKPASHENDIITWHDEITAYIKENDPFKHLISTAYANKDHSTVNSVYNLMDFTQIHHYTDYYTNNFNNVQEIYLNHSVEYLNQFDKPYMLGEHNYIEYNFNLFDKNMYNLHDNLWATLFNGSMGPASIWSHFEVSNQQANSTYFGIGKYVANLPKLSENHSPFIEYDNYFRICYLKDQNSDEYYGWIQDVNFTFRNIIENNPNYLLSFSPSFRPNHSNSSTKTIYVSRNGSYYVRWYNTSTGDLHSISTVNSSNNQLTLTIPSSLRNSIHGDASFIITFNCNSKWNTSVLNNSMPPNLYSNTSIAVNQDKQVHYVSNDFRIHQIYWNGFFWQESVLNSLAPQNVRSDSDIAINGNNDVFFIGTDNRVHMYYWSGSDWQETTLNSNAPQNVSVDSDIATYHNDRIFFVGTDSKIHQYYKVGTNWTESVVIYNLPVLAMLGTELEVDNNGNIYYIGENSKLYKLIRNGTNWSYSDFSPSAPNNVRYRLVQIGSKFRKKSNSSLALDPSGNSIFFIANDNRIHNYYWNGNIWQEATLNSNAPQNVKTLTEISCDNSGKVYFIATDHRIHQYYWNNGWIEAVNNNLDPQNANNKLVSDGENLYFKSSDSKLWSSYWGCKEIFKSHESTNDNHDDFFVEQNDLNVNFIFPNPGNGNFKIFYTSIPNDLSITKICDLSGREVNFEYFKKSDGLEINIENEINGVYFIELFNGSATEFVKYIKLSH